MNIRSNVLRTDASGFSLVEIMVALVIGMISMLVVLQTYSASEAQKRTTTGGDDAQVAGSIGLFQVERDLTEAGWGITSSAILGCTLTLPTGKTITLAPVTINSSSLNGIADTNTDTLLIVYSNGTGGPIEGNYINSVTSTTTYSLQAPAFFAKGDYVIAAGTANVPNSAPNCSSLALDTVTTGGTTTGSTIIVKTGASNVGGGTLFDLGSAPVIVGYAVVNGNLSTCSLLTKDCTVKTNWSVISGNISSLRAVYGHDNNSGQMNDVVDTWDQTAPSTTCGWIRTSAVSLAMVARNTQYTPASGSTYPTSSAPVWADPAWSSGTLTWGGAVKTSVNIDLSSNAGIATGTWQNYRYKLYETVVTLRNVTWEGANYTSTGAFSC